MRGSDVAAAAAEMTRTLTPHQDADWSVPAGTLEWSCRTTAAHIAHDLLAYTGQVTSHADDAYLPFDLVVRDDAAPHDILRIAASCAGMLAQAVNAAGPDARAWHWGPCDPSGFAAMGVAEILLHTHDITLGLGVKWTPPAELVTGVLRRLFPDAPAGEPVAVLLWCTGRGELEGRGRRTSWTWRAAVD